MTTNASMNISWPMSEKHAEFFEKRGISIETAARLGVFTGRAARDGEERWVEPDHHGDILCFPTYESGVEASIKYRATVKGERRFWQKIYTKRTFYNSDAIELAISQSLDLIIVEGEPDCLITIDAGFENCVSVPDGSPSDKDEHGNPIPMKPDHEIDPTNDPKFSFIFENWDRLKGVKRFLLALDNDGPGIRMREEIARRVGKARCSFIEYPSEAVVPVPGAAMRPVKDMNEVALFFGIERVAKIIGSAKAYPVSGIYRLNDFEERKLKLFDVGMSPLEGIMKLWHGAFVIVSGLPGSGKSAVADEIAFNMAKNHKWTIAIASLEEDVKPFMRSKLRKFFYAGRKPTLELQAEADAFIMRHFLFIARDPKGHDDSLCTVKWLIEKAEDAVIRDGIDMLVIDPWNELDHIRERDQRGDEYLNAALKDIKDFGKRRSICTVIVAHPTKTAANNIKEGAATMSLFDISDGAAWANKAELGIIVHRRNHKDVVTNVHVKKVKFHETGRVDVGQLVFDESLRMFGPGQVGRYDDLITEDRTPF